MKTKTITYISIATAAAILGGALLAFTLKEKMATGAAAASSVSSQEVTPDRHGRGNSSESGAVNGSIDMQGCPDIGGRVIAVKGADNITILDSVFHNPVKIRLRGVFVRPEPEVKKTPDSKSKGRSAADVIEPRKDSLSEQSRLYLSTMVFGAEVAVRKCVTESTESEYAASGILFRNDQNITLELLRSKTVEYKADELDYLSADQKRIYDNYESAKALLLKEDPVEERSGLGAAESGIDSKGKNDKYLKSLRLPGRNALRNESAQQQQQRLAQSEEKSIPKPVSSPVKSIRRMESEIKIRTPR